MLIQPQAGIHSPIRYITGPIIRVPPPRGVHEEGRPSRTFSAINLIDIVIVIAVLIGVANGYRRGFWLSLFQYSGLVLGVVAGAALAPTILDALHLNNGGV